MAEFTLKKKPVEYLNVNIGDETYKVPLGKHLTPKEWIPLETPEGTRAFFCKFIQSEITDELTMDEWNSLINAWKTESAKSGRSAGE